MFDRWLAELSGEAFIQLLPLVRRAFADFTGPECRQMGEKVKRLRAGSDAPLAARESVEIDRDRAAQVLPVLKHILGVK